MHDRLPIQTQPYMVCLHRSDKKIQYTTAIVLFTNELKFKFSHIVMENMCSSTVVVHKNM